LTKATRKRESDGGTPGRAAALRAWALPLALLAVAVAVGYGPALGNELVWDDRIHSLENPAVRAGRLGEGSYYRPLVFATFALEAQAVGEAPSLFHATNLALHALVACLLFAAAVALGAERAVALGAERRVALAGALLFALHPVQSEAVLYVSGRTDVLGAVFALATLLLHARAARWRDAPALPGAGAGAVLCFALSLACKESLAALPVALAVGDRLFAPPRRRALRACLLGLWPYALVLAAYAGWRASLAGAGLVVSGPGGPARLAAALAALAEYARLLVWPVGLHLERFVSFEPLWRPVAALLLLALGLASAWRARPAIRFWLAWAALAYLPTSNLLPVYPGLPSGLVFAPEHFLYLPSTGLLMALVLAAAPRVPRSLAGAGLAAILLVFAAILHDRARDWRDEETLYGHTLAHAPESARVRLNLGNVFLARGETERAVAQFEAGLAHHPDDADLLTNAGVAWMSLGRFAPAERALGRVVAMDSHDAQAWANLGALYGTTGRWREARRAYANALARDPQNPDARAGMRMLGAKQSPAGPRSE
jgi:tetratricopeptide (TPR) repeat protein